VTWDDVLMTGESLTGAFSSDGGAHGDVGVLLCHGFTGSPASLRPWADHLAATGYSVRLPLLPGHGTRWQDMNPTTFEQWLSAARAGLDELSDRCRCVVVGGLSMGGTLALRLAELHPERVAGLMLVNPSVMTTRFDARFAPVLRRLQPVLLRVMPSLPGIVDDIAKPGVTEAGYHRMPIVAALSLQAAWPVVRADLPLVTSPLLLLHSRVDHVVEPANSAIVLADVSSRDVREVMLENSYHVATLDHDAQLIFSESVDFIERVTAP
jgi:carboxylesterase